MTDPPSDKITFKSQDIDYLGFLEAQLRDLQDPATLAYELVQNADDAGAEDSAGAEDGAGGAAVSRLTFDVTDEALIVENDGRFRDIDFARLQRIASGAKREERGTTGAFGLGFLAVYQVTDAPEIFSSGRHWRIRPEAPTEQRIEERPAESQGTRFRLPWAFDESSVVRRALRLAVVRADKLDDLAGALAQAIVAAALFLRHLRLLEVRRSGELIRRVERRIGPDDRLELVDESGRVTSWLLPSGEFEEAAAGLRRQYPWQIEAARHSAVRLALPLPKGEAPQSELSRTQLSRGRLYATLPTSFSLPLPFHVDADFFPTVDRKSIHFDGGYQTEWNQAAIGAAARLLAANLDRLPAVLGPVGLWQLIERTALAAQAAEQGELPTVFATFWRELARRLPEVAVVFSANGQWQPPGAVAVLPRRSESEAAFLLAALGLTVPHPDLAPFRHLLGRPEIGVAELGPADIAQALLQAGLNRSTPLGKAPPALRLTEAWQVLWRVLDTMLSEPQPPAEREESLARLRPCALALGQQMTLERLDRLFRGSAGTRALFPDVVWLHDSLTADAFPGHYVTEFTVRQAVEWLAERPGEDLEQAWRLGRLDLPGLFRWFEDRPIEIFADDPALQKEIRRLPLVPVDGRLRPLAGLYLPGGFADPLHLAGVVDLESIGGRRQFLIDLGLAGLDFESYVHGPMQRALADQPDLPSDARHRLARLLAERLGELRDDPELQEQLSGLPLVACLDGTFRPGREVFLEREAIELLGDQTPIAEPADSHSLLALYRWLGARDQPGPADLFQALLNYADQPEGGNNGVAARRCWERLAGLLAVGEITAADLHPLRGRPTFPGQAGRLLRPETLVVVDRPELAAGFGDLKAADEFMLAAGGTLAAVAQAAGARLLSQAVQRQVLVSSTVVDTMVGKRLAERRDLLARLLRGEGETRPDEQLAFLRGLAVVAADRIQVQYRLEISGQAFTTAPEMVPAVLDGEPAALYVTVGERAVSWPAVARAVAEAIRLGGPAGGLAIGIKEILAAETAAQAARSLDELGYA